MPIAVTKFDNRRDKTFPIARSEIQTFEIVSGVTMTNNIHLNGQLLGYIYTCPNLTTDSVFKIEYLDKDGAVLYSKADLADNETDPFAVFLTSTELIYLYGAHDMRITYVTSQTATIVVSSIYR